MNAIDRTDARITTSNDNYAYNKLVSALDVDPIRSSPVQLPLDGKGADKVLSMITEVNLVLRERLEKAGRRPRNPQRRGEHGGRGAGNRAVP